MSKQLSSAMFKKVNNKLFGHKFVCVYKKVKPYFLSVSKRRLKSILFLLFIYLFCNDDA